MSIGAIIFTVLIRPIQLVFELIYNLAYENIHDAGLSIIALSLAMNFLVLPLYMRADAMQEEERETEEKLGKWVKHIKKTFKGDERTMMLQTYYRQNNYSPTAVLRGAASLFLEIPFFIAAYMYLSHLEVLQGVKFGPIADLSQPDGLLLLSGITVNALPIIMTLINVISTMIFTKGHPLKTKIQLYAMALFFLVFLYKSPAGLVFYWTLNNLFSLVKTILYKVKNPKLTISVLSAMAGVAALVYAVRAEFGGSHRILIYLIGALGVILIAPIVIYIVNRVFKREKKVKEYRKPSRRAFVACTLFMAVMLGVLIPSEVIKASPQEFIDFTLDVMPNQYLLYAGSLAFGLFVVWFNVFYWLASAKGKVVIENLMMCVCAIACLDYFFFGKGLGLVNPDLTLENGVGFSMREICLNAAAIGAAVLVILIITLWKPAIARSVVSVSLIAFLCMSVMNVNAISRSVDKAQSAYSSSEEGTPYFTLSKNKKNVVVIMLDRAQGVMLPYIFNEDKTLKDKYDGFTYYSNTVSFGRTTNTGSPALYGGYEYTPVEINKRDKESLATKQNEALKVMPVLFDQNGYDTTVLDPTYAGYQWVPDLSIYDEYPNIRKFNAKGVFNELQTRDEIINGKGRNFFMYSIMKSSPEVLQKSIYNKGSYNFSTDDSTANGQVFISNSKAQGIRQETLNAYSTLLNLDTMTKIVDRKKGSFVMMSNDTTHDAMMMQEPEYAIKYDVDNEDYDKAHQGRFTVNGKTLHMEDSWDYAHYESNMASLKLIGVWLDYLRKEGVYDNTRIIIVADHGFPNKALDELMMDDISLDVEALFPLLMVKDFDAKGFTESDVFMTNADVPTIATGGLIKDPHNPMTGKALNNKEKFAHKQYILYTVQHNIAAHKGNAFNPDKWYTVSGSIWDRKNWTYINEKKALKSYN